MATKPTAQPERVERRREQNRNNQRAYRRRKLLQAQLLTDRKTEAGQIFSPSTGAGSNSRTLLLQEEDEDEDLHLCNYSEPRKRILVGFAQSATESYSRGEPSADHLLTLTKVNVVRAFTRNLRSLGWPRTCMERSAISPFVNVSQLPQATNHLGGSCDYSRIPASLRPTHRQQSVPHHPWLDLFPLARMRDNLIAADRGGWDCEQLCSDIMGFWGRAEERPGGIALLVWGEPSDVSSWEVTEGLESTNAWRRKRGEKLILRYL
ncbi:hypothetical protein BJX66DRAFT_330267 [Aspergillus keveii]|uniref:BZIP domain-containing protein n=1 Tax=Aspergillus keveii TaxID=714993 RepID=A0ABR4FL85_9EURO